MFSLSTGLEPATSRFSLILTAGCSTYWAIDSYLNNTKIVFDATGGRFRDDYQYNNNDESNENYYSYSGYKIINNTLNEYSMINEYSMKINETI